MFSASSRFGQCSTPLVNPMEKLQETVDLLLEQRISHNDYTVALFQVGEFVERAQDMLAEVEFPPNYDAGPVLLEYARQGMESMAEAVDNLTQLWDKPDPQWAQSNLQLAREAFQSLQELLAEVQAERGAA